MKSIRLLPVVIAAALALLLFKGIGLLTGDGYVLTGEVFAASGAPAADHGTTTAEGTETTMELPSEPTMVDDNPTLTDDAPTLGGEPGGDHGAPATETGTASEHSTEGAEPAAEDHGAPAEHSDAPAEAPAAAPSEDHGAAAPEAAAEPAATDHGAPPAAGDHGAPPASTEPAGDPRAEGVPMIQDGSGTPVPLASPDGSSLTETIILERLSARRAELDTREEELTLRLQLLEAAEAKLDERAAALAEVEARVNAMLDAQKAEEEGHIAAVINMYEQMKPADAASIFNDLNLEVLVKIASGMNPRKMSPILAKMSSVRAQQVTLALAAMTPEPVAAPVAAAPGGENLAELPQIVGE